MTVPGPNARIGVAPFAGAWIEISLRSKNRFLSQVAPFAGAWIEIVLMIRYAYRKRVAPFAGAWIEIEQPSCIFTLQLSLPSRERGLKCVTAR